MLQSHIQSLIVSFQCSIASPTVGGEGAVVGLHSPWVVEGAAYSTQLRVPHTPLEADSSDKQHPGQQEDKKERN